MTPLGIQDDDSAVRTEAAEVSLALAGALEDAGLRLPQFAADTPDGDHLIRLGTCNVRVGMALHDAGLLLPMRIRHAGGRPAIWIEGISPEAAEELALTVQAGLEARVIRG